MGISNAYLVDRAKILRVQPLIASGVISKQNSKAPTGDWIKARLQPVDGNEIREMGQVKLVHSHTLILYKVDESGNEVCPIQSDEFELKVNRNGKISDSIDKFKIVGAIQEIRKRTTVQSYVVPVVLETEH